MGEALWMYPPDDEVRLGSMAQIDKDSVIEERMDFGIEFPTH